mmetsp:Transcript_58669/g.154536  ORF Transcript_58669/g.154536 Transcript_58669/m.154536 type:complete len:275 (+) Transcript_58669:93-917(+)
MREDEGQVLWRIEDLCPLLTGGDVIRRGGNVRSHQFSQAGQALRCGGCAKDTQVVAEAELPLQIPGRSNDTDLALVQDCLPAGQHIGLVQVVRGEEDGSPLTLHPHEQVPEFPPIRRVHAGGRLVQKHHRRLAQEACRHPQAPLLTPAQGLHPRLALFGQPQCLQGLVDLQRRARQRHAAQGGEEGQVLVHGELVVKWIVLGAHAEVAPRLLELRGHVDAADVDGALRHGQHPCDAVDRRGLAGAVVPEEREDLRAADLQTHAVHSLVAAKGLH